MTRSSRSAHVLWSPQTGPICAYEDGVMAHAHGRTMLGVQVATIDLRTELPEIARADLAAEFDAQFEDETPVDEIPPVLHKGTRVTARSPDDRDGDETPVDEIPIDAIDDADTRVVDVDDE